MFLPVVASSSSAAALPLAVLPCVTQKVVSKSADAFDRSSSGTRAKGKFRLEYRKKVQRVGGAHVKF